MVTIIVSLSKYNFQEWQWKLLNIINAKEGFDVDIVNTFATGSLSMHPAFPYRIKGQQLWLSPDRCVFWEEERSLIVSDLHFGKTGHFRKAGIAVPQSVYREDLLRLLCQIQYFQPRQLLVVGDLFHSRENKELALFLKWREDFPDLGIRLIEGNHDILHEDWYKKAGINVSRDVLGIGPFAFIHDITGGVGGTLREGEVAEGGGVTVADSAVAAAGEETPYYFSGHIHPGIRIRGIGKQSLQFPCFYFGTQYAVLPAFGRFTGTVPIDPLPESNVFAILPPSGGESGWQAHRSNRVVMGPGGEDRRPPVSRPRSMGPKGSGSILQIQ
jgi:DNA ligase-associated metallophosphoesterase